jgi:hypothetical protein
MQNSSTLFQADNLRDELILIGFRAELKAFKESFALAPADDIVGQKVRL